MGGLIIEGFDKAAAAVGKIMQSMQKAVQTEVDRVANQGFNEIIGNTPVRTGYLKSRWKITFDSNGGFTIENDAPYASFVEFGTGRMEGRNFVMPVYHIMISEINAMTSKFSKR
jgi:HK97 gp10 family phage protein